MKQITYSIQASDSNLELTAETLGLLLPKLASTQLFKIGYENASVSFIDACSQYQGMTPEEAVAADKGNVHVALDTLVKLEGLVNQITELAMDYTVESVRVGIDVKTQALQHLMIKVQFRTGDLDDCSDTLESDSKLRLDYANGQFTLNEASVDSTIVSLYAGLDIWDNPNYVSIVKKEDVDAFIEGFSPEMRDTVSSYMVKYVDDLFKSTILKHSTDIVNNLKKHALDTASA